MPPPPGGKAPPASQPLSERQRSVGDRLARLEGVMLNLVRTLAESEPQRAERLRDALALSGRERVRARIEQLVALLQGQKLSLAERGQEELLRSLSNVMALLTTTNSDIDRRRAERQRLEALRRGIRELMESQMQQLSRAIRAASAEPDEALRPLQAEQRETERRTRALHRSAVPERQPESPTAGAEPLGRAADHMRAAGDELGRPDPQAAQEEQKAAIRDLQESLDELDDALRQLRREEAEETLATLEARFRAMLERERFVRGVVAELSVEPSVASSQAAHRRLAAAAETQAAVADECATVLRILVDEGTTVILPDLVERLAADVAAVGERLAAADLTSTTLEILDDVIATLEEIVGAIETRRGEAEPPEPPPGASEAPAPLLPGSAELRLLRSAQVRINVRTAAIADAGGDEPAAAAASLQHLARRQRELAAMAQRMNERK